MELVSVPESGGQLSDHSTLPQDHTGRAGDHGDGATEHADALLGTGPLTRHQGQFTGGLTTTGWYTGKPILPTEGDMGRREVTPGTTGRGDTYMCLFYNEYANRVPQRLQ